MNDILWRLEKTIASRKEADPEKSYVAKLFKKGDDAILKKVGEEATETVMAAKDARHGLEKEKVIYECADLWFHVMVMMSHWGISIDEVLNELARREGISGITEKASRPK